MERNGLHERLWIWLEDRNSLAEDEEGWCARLSVFLFLLCSTSFVKRRNKTNADGPFDSIFMSDAITLLLPYCKGTWTMVAGRFILPSYPKTSWSPQQTSEVKPAAFHGGLILLCVKPQQCWSAELQSGSISTNKWCFYQIVGVAAQKTTFSHI